MNEDPDIAAFESAGYDEICRRLTIGVYANERLGKAQRWVAQEAEKKRHAAQAESLAVATATKDAAWTAAESARLSAEEAKAANDLARDANEIARQANAKATTANEIARQSSQSARWAALAAIVAAAMAVMAFVLRK